MHNTVPSVAQVVQIIAALTATAIALPVIMYAYGYSMPQLEQFFGFGAGDIAAKTFLGIAMVIMIFSARPRSRYLRAILAAISCGVLVYAVYGAASQSLLLGDTLIYLVGSFIGTTETLETKLPERAIQPASKFHQPPSLKP